MDWNRADPGIRSRLQLFATLRDFTSFRRNQGHELVEEAFWKFSSQCGITRIDDLVAGCVHRGSFCLTGISPCMARRFFCLGRACSASRRHPATSGSAIITRSRIRPVESKSGCPSRSRRICFGSPNLRCGLERAGHPAGPVRGSACPARTGDPYGNRTRAPALRGP